jgi:hypothetical protein
MDGYLRGDGRLPQVERRDIFRYAGPSGRLNHGLNGMGYHCYRIFSAVSGSPVRGRDGGFGRPIGPGGRGGTAVRMRRLAVPRLTVAAARRVRARHCPRPVSAASVPGWGMIAKMPAPHLMRDGHRFSDKIMLQL